MSPLTTKTRIDEASLTQYLLPETNLSKVSPINIDQANKNLGFNPVVVPSVSLSHRSPTQDPKANTQRLLDSPSVPDTDKRVSKR